MPVYFIRVDAEPGSRRTFAMSIGDQVLEDRFQQIHRHEHVPGRRCNRSGGVANDERADPEKLALRADERRARPFLDRWVGEDRRVEQVFPAAGEGPARHDVYKRRRIARRRCNHHRGIALGERGRIAELERLAASRGEKAQQREAARMVVGRDRRRQHAPIGGRDLNRFRLDHEIPDGEHEPFADQDARAAPLGAQRGGAAGVRPDLRLHPDDGRKDLFRLVLCRKGTGREQKNQRQQGSLHGLGYHRAPSC